MHTLKDLQNTIAERIAADEVLNQADVFIHDSSILPAGFSESSNAYLGLSILIMPPLPYKSSLENAFEGIRITLHILENRYSNPTGLSSLSVAERLCECLQGYKLPDTLFPETLLTLAENSPWKIIKDSRYTNCNLLELTFNTADRPY